MMRKVYIVFGQTGEYSDHRDWVVAAYLDKAAAEKRVADCMAGIPGNIPRYGFDREIYKNPHDDQFQYDYTGTEYFLSITDLVDGASVSGAANPDNNGTFDLRQHPIAERNLPAGEDERCDWLNAGARTLRVCTLGVASWKEATTEHIFLEGITSIT